MMPCSVGFYTNDQIVKWTVPHLLRAMMTSTRLAVAAVAIMMRRPLTTRIISCMLVAHALITGWSSIICTHVVSIASYCHCWLDRRDSCCLCCSSCVMRASSPEAVTQTLDYRFVMKAVVREKESTYDVLGAFLSRRLGPGPSWAQSGRSCGIPGAWGIPLETSGLALTSGSSSAWCSPCVSPQPWVSRGEGGDVGTWAS